MVPTGCSRHHRTSPCSFTYSNLFMAFIFPRSFSFWTLWSSTRCTNLLWAWTSWENKTETRWNWSLRRDEGFESGWGSAYSLPPPDTENPVEKEEHLESNQWGMPRCLKDTELGSLYRHAVHTCLSPAGWTRLHRESRYGQNLPCWCWRSWSRRLARRRWMAHSSCRTLWKVPHTDNLLSFLWDSDINNMEKHKGRAVPGVILFLLSSLKPCKVFTPLCSRLDIMPSFTGQ